MNLEEHLKRQIAFSIATYGPGVRTEGVSDHIRKELAEIAAEVSEGAPASPEWVDVLILALDGLTRALRAENPTWTHNLIAKVACTMLVDKEDKNERREWPDWRTADPGKAIEHVRSEAELIERQAKGLDQ